MTRLLPLLFLAGIAAEIASIILVGDLVGVLATLLLLLGGGVLGVGLMKSAGTNIVAALRGPVQASSLQRGAAGDAMAKVLAGLLFLIPGFFSDLIGFLLLLPPVRLWLRSKIRVQSFSTAGPAERRYDTVIDGEAVEITGEVLPPTRVPGREGGPS